MDHAAVETWKASWTEDHEESPTHQQVSTFTESLSLLREAEQWVDPIRTITAAVHGAGERCGTIQESLESLSEQERADIVMEWVDAWYFLTGDAPDNFFLSVVQDQVDKVSNISPSLHRLKISACVAAYHRSWNLHHGLTPNELAALDHSADRQNAIDIWTRCFYEAGRRWPSDEEVTAYLRELDTVGGCPAGEVSSAAARAGTSLSTALREFLAEQPTTEVTSRGSERGSEGSVLAFRPRAKRWQADGEGER
ncbi:hypothetical protein [Streptomyces sp. NPDC048272]|uniref:hypothetical protein n=1 Tax=Streptomyces sp. NPDC048272 TaxID=3154616 RepID=UPI0034449B6A